MRRRTGDAGSRKAAVGEEFNRGEGGREIGNRKTQIQPK